MSKLNVEAVKRESHGLRGTIPDELALPSDHFSDESVALLKFHGVYQQDDRDARKSARETGAGKDFGFMVRTKNPGGYLPAPFYAAVDELADRYGNGTIRVTTRGGLQLHGIAKANLHEVIAQINRRLGSTLGACGDINRNVMAPPFPFASASYAHARAAAASIADLLTPQATAYYEIWQNGEVVYDASAAAEPVADTAPVEPIYGATFLPRKFKIAVTVPGDNSVDLYTNDVGVVALTGPDGALEGYNLVVGGGLGMTHGKTATYPRLADEFGFVAPGQMLEAVRAIVVVQRDNGDRTNRKHARLKYLIADRGLDWFRGAVEAEAGFAIAPWRALPAWEVPAYAGWHAQGDGRYFYGLEILSGRVFDGPSARTKAALREIVAATGRDLVATPDQNIVIADVESEQRGTIDAILARHDVAVAGGLLDAFGGTSFGRTALACPALPTCGLALAESERALPALLAELQAAWLAAGLRDGAPTVRMTGCPNGCARPYLGEIGIVGVSADRYNLYLGGNTSSTRLNVLYREALPRAQIAPVLAPLFADFAAQRLEGEAFGDFCDRVRLERMAS